VFVISPWPRFVRSPCCSELEHTTNFAEPDFLKTIISDLNRLRCQLRKLVSPATVLDCLELICGHGYNKEKVSQVIQAGWGHDPVHPNKHIYAKMALNLIERMSVVKTEASSTSSRKRTWSSTNSDASGSSSHLGGGGGWRRRRRRGSPHPPQLFLAGIPQQTGLWIPRRVWEPVRRPVRRFR
jgi:hypothetical protein